jgi:hypothetical protein
VKIERHIPPTDDLAILANGMQEILRMERAIEKRYLELVELYLKRKRRAA